jgi:hypothetical protein
VGTGPYTEELVYTTTDDGLLLEGVIIRPAGIAVKPLSFVWIHGNAARFYDYAYVAICRALASAGYPCVSGNTRGHDIAAFVWRGPQNMPIGGGAGWESLEDAPIDVAAWVQVATDLAEGGVVLAGHSSGAQRVVLYQAERQDARVRGMALASPDLQSFLAPGELVAAEQLVAQGRGLEVVPAQPYAPFYRQSAASVVSRAAVVARLQASDSAAIGCPVLAFFGAQEPGSTEALERVAGRLSGAVRVDRQVISAADHFYNGRTAEVAEVIAEWAATLG